MPEYTSSGKEIKIVPMGQSQKESPTQPDSQQKPTNPGGANIYRDTTVPLPVHPKNVLDTSEVSTPYSKKKQV